MGFRHIYILAVALLFGCEVHQFPEPKSFGMILHLHYEPDFYVWEHYYDPALGSISPIAPPTGEGVDEAHPGTSSVYDNQATHGIMRIVVRVYPKGNLDTYLREFIFYRDIIEGKGYDCDVNLDIGAGNYDIAVWSDIKEDANNSYFYNSDNFRRVFIVNEHYLGNTDFRDGYRGRVEVELAHTQRVQEPEHREVTMRRPMGKYEFITTDLSEFLDRETTRRALSTRASAEDYRVVIAYPAFYPSSYSVISNRLENAATGFSYETRMTVTGENDASLGFDYVLINDIPDAGVLAEIGVYDMEGNQVAHSRQITVPLRRDHHTILRGAFLSTNASGGVGIDPGFDGDHNVVVP